MDKEQAKTEMILGKRVAHRYFMPEEYIYMKLGIIYDETDYEHGCFNEFLNKRSDAFKDGWRVY